MKHSITILTALLLLAVTSAVHADALKTNLSGSAGQTGALSTVTPLVRDCDTGYLLNCNFRAIRPYMWDKKVLLTGWETDDRGGSWESFPNGLMPKGFSFDVDWFKLIDTSSDYAVTIKKKIARQSSGEITLEFRFKLSARMEGATWQLRDLEQPGLSIVTSGENLCYQTKDGKLKVLSAYELNREYGVKAVADLKKRWVNIYIDGQLRASNVPFVNRIKTIDYVLVKTGDKSIGELYINPINIYKGYNLYETFVANGAGSLPENWTVSIQGDSIVEAVPFAAKPDIYSLKLDGGAAGSKFPALKQKAAFEFRFMIPVRADASVELTNGNSPVVRVAALGKNLCIIDSHNNAVPVVRNYVTNLWYDIKLILDSAKGKADVYVNGKKVAKDAYYCKRAKKLDGIRFAVEDRKSVMWVDDIKIYPWRDYPADYVPEPELPKPADNYLVGVQSCSLWKEGDSYSGWDYILPYADKRKPYLGWYDEGNPEVSDWEIKWQLEHGIDFEQYCWYRSDSGINHPIKDGLLEHGIREGLFNARYSQLKKFTIMYTNEGAGRTNANDWSRNIIPYWIEYFFKDPRYLKINGKPVLSVYWLPHFLIDFGGAEGAAKAIAVLRKACRDAGFPGIIILMEDRSARKSKLQQMKSMGIDYCYAYTWGTCNTDTQKKKMAKQRQVGNELGLGVIPSFCVGWQTAPWGGGGDGMMSPADYKAMAKWTRENYMPLMAENSLGRRMVLLPNWNEYGEGHFIIPSASAGFGYLDALKEVFTVGGPHKNVVPTDKQKQRFTLFYPKD